MKPQDAWKILSEYYDKDQIGDNKATAIYDEFTNWKVIA